MYSLLEQEWRARRVLVAYADSFPGSWACALLRALGAQVVPLSATTPLNAETLCRVFNQRRPCMALLPHLQGESMPPQAFERLQTLHLVLSEAREAGLRAVILLCRADAYQSRPGLRIREGDPLGGDSAQGCIQSLLETYALGFSRGLFGDPTAVILARHAPLTGGGMEDGHFAMRWCDALARGDVLPLNAPGTLYPFVHPLEAVGGALLCGAMLLKHGVQYAGAWNFAPGIRSLATCRSAASNLREYAGGSRPLVECTQLPRPQYQPLDDHRSRERLGYKTAFDAYETLSMLYDYHTQEDKSQVLDLQAERYLRTLDALREED